ncbi:glycosyltransferase family 2 protein [Candidatus Fermentibacteria bacterium]|nr:glycosyltransferase family 2 protein [Candidatus Fermentibacteria bacterium]
MATACGDSGHASVTETPPRGARRPPSILVVIPSHNGGELTVSCLERLLPQLREGDRVVVVDNGSWDGSAQTIRKRFDGEVPVIRHRRPLGFGPACNLGATGTRADLILFLNQDLLLSPDGLATLRESADLRPGAIIGALLFGPEGMQVQHAGGIILPNALTEHPHRGVAAGELPRMGFVTCDYVTGALFMVRADIFRALGGFDERFRPAYYEETDFCVRARARGIPSLVALRVTARHFEAVVMGRDSPRYHRAYHRNRLRFVMKHYTRHAIRTAFVPAERRWRHSALSASARRAVFHAYAATLLESPRWVFERRRRPPSFAPQEVAP